MVDPCLAQQKHDGIQRLALAAGAQALVPRQMVHKGFDLLAAPGLEIIRTQEPGKPLWPLRPIAKMNLLQNVGFAGSM